MKCDIVIPVYNHFEWVKLCVKAIFANTNMKVVNKVLIIDDNSSIETKEELKKIREKYGEKIELIFNKKNQGFVKNCNYAMKITSSDYVLLLNSDCIISKNAIEKMLRTLTKDKKIGLLCPISSKAANLTFPLIEGLNYQDINSLFEKQFKDKIFDACTVVGNCLMISRKCINTIGYFDEIFEKGYTEETDYQFRALKEGFKAKVLIDTYVFHECRVSFGEDEKQLKIRQEHLSIFFDRWGKEYNKLYEKYEKNDPIKYIKEHLNINDIDYFLKYKLSKKVTEKEINELNDLIIEGHKIKIEVNKKNNSWEKFNTLFIPRKTSLKKITIERK